MAASRELAALLGRARRTRLARRLAAAVGITLGVCIVAGVRVTVRQTPAHASTVPR